MAADLCRSFLHVTPTLAKNEKYAILNKDEIRDFINDEINNLSTKLSLPIEETVIILQHFNWDTNQSYQEWFECEKRVRSEAGLFATPVVKTQELVCRKCYLYYPRGDIFSVSCGHQFCRHCWQGYIRNAIAKGPICLALRCAEDSCDATVGYCFLERFSSDDASKKQLEEYLLVEFTRCHKAKWCPALHCNYAMFSLDGEETKEDKNVICKCSNSFCFNCRLQECHAPACCTTVSTWMREVDSIVRKVDCNSVRFDHCLQQWETCKSGREAALARIELVNSDFIREIILQVAVWWQYLRWSHVWGYMYGQQLCHDDLGLFEGGLNEATNSVKDIEELIDVSICGTCDNQQLSNLKRIAERFFNTIRSIMQAHV